MANARLNSADSIDWARVKGDLVRYARKHGTHERVQAIVDDWRFVPRVLEVMGNDWPSDTDTLARRIQNIVNDWDTYNGLDTYTEVPYAKW